jgi:hypothetical protein
MWWPRPRVLQGDQTSISPAEKVSVGVMDFFGRGNAPIAFYDVADGDALLAILNRPQDVRDG